MKRLLVHEFVSGGSLAGRPVSPSLAREGAAMRDALVADLAALGRHRIVTTADARFPLGRTPAGVEVVTLAKRRDLDALLASCGETWLVAPETRGCLERLAARALAAGTRLVGPSPAAIRRAADKGELPRRLARHGVAHPETLAASTLAESAAAARAIGFPLVVKPARGAGCEGVSLVRAAHRLPAAVSAARRAGGGGPWIVQRYVEGVAASVSLLCDGRRAIPLAVNAQSLRASGRFVYRGGATPLAHPLAGKAVAAALAACRALPGLKGYVGVDVVLTERGAVVIEVNPRLTTAYLGVRESLGVNVAGLALLACAGRLSRPPRPRRRVRFTGAGRILAA